MKLVTTLIIGSLIICNHILAEDIKPAEIKEMTVIGTGPTINSSMQSCYNKMYNSCKRIESVSNRDSQWTGAGWITTYEVKYKIIH
jgi:hypothetical protein